MNLSHLSVRISNTLFVVVKDRYVERKMVMKEESPIENEWRRWSTSFSSVPAFTHWERDTADWRQTGRRRCYCQSEASADMFSQSHMTYHWTSSATMLLFDHHCVDHAILLFLHHSRL